MKFVYGAYFKKIQQQRIEPLQSLWRSLVTNRETREIIYLGICLNLELVEGLGFGVWGTIIQLYKAQGIIIVVLLSNNEVLYLLVSRFQ